MRARTLPAGPPSGAPPHSRGAPGRIDNCATGYEVRGSRAYRWDTVVSGLRHRPRRRRWPPDFHSGNGRCIIVDIYIFGVSLISARRYRQRLRAHSSRANCAPASSAGRHRLSISAIFATDGVLSPTAHHPFVYIDTRPSPARGFRRVPYRATSRLHSAQSPTLGRPAISDAAIYLGLSIGRVKGTRRDDA